MGGVGEREQKKCRRKSYAFANVRYSPSKSFEDLNVNNVAEKASSTGRTAWYGQSRLSRVTVVASCQIGADAAMAPRTVLLITGVEGVDIGDSTVDLPIVHNHPSYSTLYTTNVICGVKGECWGISFSLLAVVSFFVLMCLFVVYALPMIYAVGLVGPLGQFCP